VEASDIEALQEQMRADRGNDVVLDVPNPPRRVSGWDLLFLVLNNLDGGDERPEVLFYKDGMVLSLRIDATPVGVACTDLQVHAQNRPLTAQDIRSIPFGVLSRIAHEALVEAAHRQHRWTEDLGLDPVSRTVLLRDLERTFEEGGRTGDLTYARLADQYLRFVDAGSKRPVAALAEYLEITSQTVSERLRTARNRGILTSSGSGQAGGSLTEKGLQLLADQSEEQA
jgi:hypothetical protein